MTTKRHLPILFLIIFFLSALSLTSCGDDSSTKQAKMMSDPFATKTLIPLSTEKKDRYEQYQLTEQAYQLIVEKLQKFQQSIKNQGGKLTYTKISYDKKDNSAEINDLLIEYDLADVSIMQLNDFVDSKTIKVNWYDDKNKLPYYIKASLLDVLTPSKKFLGSAAGKDYSQFIKKIGLGDQTLRNWSDIVYEYDDKTGKLALALNDDLNKLMTLRLVSKLDGISKQVFDMLADDSTAQNPALLLGMLSAVRLEEVYIKIKLEKTLDEFITAMPEQDGIELRKNYDKNKNISDAEIAKQLGDAFTLEQIKQFRTAWINFVEHKKPLYFTVKPDIPQAFTALFSGFMMAQQSPKMASGIIKQLKISMSN